MNHDSEPAQVSPADREVQGPVPLAVRTSPRARVPGIGPVLAAGIVTLLLSETAVECVLWLTAVSLHATLPQYVISAAKLATAVFTLCMLLVYRARTVLALDEARRQASESGAGIAPAAPAADATEARIAHR